MILFWLGLGVGVGGTLIAVLGLDMYLSRTDHSDSPIVSSHRTPKR